MEWRELLIHRIRQTCRYPTFFLCGHVTNLLAGLEFADQIELHEAVMAILDSIGKVPLGEVFLTWMARLSGCIEINGESME
jgi:hypothetical protein